MDLACSEMEENVCFKLWFKVGCSPRHTQIVPKWHLDGQRAGADFFQHPRAVRRAKKVSILAGSKFGRIRLA